MSILLFYLIKFLLLVIHNIIFCTSPRTWLLKFLNIVYFWGITWSLSNFDYFMLEVYLNVTLNYFNSSKEHTIALFEFLLLLIGTLIKGWCPHYEN